jgi:hypothetical protein
VVDRNRNAGDRRERLLGVPDQLDPVSRPRREAPGKAQKRPEIPVPLVQLPFTTWSPSATRRNVGVALQRSGPASGSRSGAMTAITPTWPSDGCDAPMPIEV